MNPALTMGRLAWCSFRTLRMLWLLCTLGVAALMLVVTAVATSQTYQGAFSFALWGLATWIPPVYVLAALATMFAGEREEGTNIWLQSLSPPLVLLVPVRIAFVAVTGLLLQLSLAGLAAGLSQFDKNFHTQDGWESIAIMTFLLLESVVIGWFWSLQTSKPLNGILLAAVSLILLNLGAVFANDIGRGFMNGTYGYRNDPLFNGPWGNAFGIWGWARILAYIGWFSLNTYLTGRWLSGRTWEWERLTTRWPRRPVRVAPIALIEESEPWQRVWSRLRWLEWQTIKNFLVMAAVASAISAISLLFTHNQREAHPTFAFILCWLAFPAAGLMAWQNEQTQNRFRALAYRGASPLALWVNKYVLWLLVTLLAVVMVVWTTFLMWQLFHVVHPERYPHWNGPPAAGRSGIAAWFWQTAAWGTLYLLTSYSLAFTCGQLFRKSVIALGSAMVLLIAYSLWFSLCIEIGFPTVVFLAPIPCWLIWISVSALPYWWLERTGWRTSYRRITELTGQVAFPGLLLLGAAGYRIWEVPSISVMMIQNPIHSSDTAGVSISANWQRIQYLLNQIRQPEATPKTVVLPDQQLLPGETSAVSKSWEDFLAANRETLVELRQQLLQTPVISRESARHHPFTDTLPIEALAALAIDELATGNPQDSVSSLQASFHLMGSYLAHANFLERRRAELTDATWRELVYAWAQHPQQTRETLTEGLNRVAEEMRFCQLDNSNLSAQYEFELEAELNSPTEYWFWERARSRRLLAVALANRVTYLEMVRSGAISTAAPPIQELAKSRLLSSWQQNPTLAKAWNFSTHWERWQSETTNMPSYVYGIPHHLGMFHMEERWRGMITVMALIGERRLTGHLPASIAEVAVMLRPELQYVLTDLFSGSYFQYEPHGLTAHELRKPRGIGPLIWSPTTLPISGSNGFSTSLQYSTINESSDIQQLQSGPLLFLIPPQTKPPAAEPKE